MLWWPRSLSSKGRDVSGRSYNNDSVELVIKPAAWPLWTPYAAESTHKRESLNQLGWLILTTKEESDYDSTLEIYATLSWLLHPCSNYNQVWSVDRRRENSSLSGTWFCMICTHHLKVDGCSTLWDTLEGQFWREILPLGRTLSSGGSL